MATFTKDEEIGLAIVGCGQIVTHHCKALGAIIQNNENNIRIRALCDPSQERRTVIRDICETFHHHHHHLLSEEVEEFQTLDDLLQNSQISNQCQVIFIAVPHDLHLPITTLALNAGKHVILEKPLAPTISHCQQLQQISQNSLGLLIVAEQSPYWQEIAKAKECIQNGSIGKLVTAASYYYESMRDNVTSGLDAEGGLGWRCSIKRCGGGIVIDGGLHWLRPLRELCGDIVSVVGVTQNCEPGLKLEGETLAHAMFKIRNKYNKPNDDDSQQGLLLGTYSANMMHTAPMCHDAAPYFRITGTKGELVVPGSGLNPDGGGGLRLYNDEYPNGKDLFPKNRQGGFFLGFQGLWKSVVSILKNNDKSAAQKSVRDAAADVALALAIYKSSASGIWEDCELFDE